MSTTTMMEHKKINWLYRYENEALYPIFVVGKNKEMIKFDINNSVDTSYTFCKVVFEEDTGDFEIKDFYLIEVPGDDRDPMMKMLISNEQGSPFVYVVVKDSRGAVIIENNYLLGDTNTKNMYGAVSSIERSYAELDNMPGLAKLKKEIEILVDQAVIDKQRKENGLPALSSNTLSSNLYIFLYVNRIILV